MIERMQNLVPTWLRARRAPKTVPAPRPKANPYRAVEIEPGREAGCAAVQALSGTRFLSAEAPSLPLPACDAQKCTCRYVQQDDRRAEPRRDADVGIGVRTVLSNDRRTSGRGRRKTD